MSNSIMEFPNYMLSQELNNHAASLIEKKCYDEAISCLAKAMQLARDSMEGSDEGSCLSCCCCSLEACIKYSTIKSQKADKRKEDMPTPTPSGYVHRQPILIDPSCLQLGHNLGHVVPLMLTFNLALAHHFKGLDETEDSIVRYRCFSKAQRLYELSDRVHEDQLDFPAQSSIWFEMMVANNLGKLHQSLSNEEEHVECMEDLMSIIMFFVDCHEPVVDPRLFDEFVRNASNLMLPCVCAVAA